MGDGLHLPVVQAEGAFQQGFAVACGTGADDLRPGREPFMQLPHSPFGGLNRISLVVRVKGKQELSFFPD